MTRRRLIIITAAALAAAAVQAGCAGPALSGAVVTLDEAGSTVCSPADADGRTVFGISAIQNVSSSAVEIGDAALVDPGGMELLGLELRATDDPDAYIVGFDYDRFGPSAVALPHQMAGGETAVTLVGVRVAPGASGSADGVTLSFRGNGGGGAVETRIAMQVVPAGEVCGSTD